MKSAKIGTMQQCGFCTMLSGLLRRAMCVGSRRGSSESYYRELGDQDTLKIEDKSSALSDDSAEIIPDAEAEDVLEKPPDDNPELTNMSQQNLNPGRFLTMHKRRKKKLLTRSLCQDSGLLDDMQFGQIKCILDQSAQWRFNAFTLDNVSGGRCLPVLCIHLFHIYGLLTYFHLDAAKIWKLFSMIEEGYHSTNPYHNSIHAADVTQAMHCFLQQKQIRDHLEPLEIMASLLAAIAHDMDHPGVNQPFLIATSNHLAALYNNTSVLENHHWRSAVSCLIQSGLLDEVQEIRVQLEHQISSLILATDITRQQEYLSQFKINLDTNCLDMTMKEHRHLVLQIALKCADISNPCRPWEISRKWSLKVCEEFFRQGDYERKLNLPVTALCDRHTTSIPKIQTGFFKYVVTPLITEWDKFLQNDLSAQMLKNLTYNQNKWETLLAQEQAEETGTEISDADMVDDELETITNISDSSELLLPLRRSSLNPIKQSGLKEQLRRFSVPLNVFQDSKFKYKEKIKVAATIEAHNQSPDESDPSLHSQLSVRGHCEHHGAVEKVLSTEKLLPDSSIASITTPVQATRLNTVLKDGATWKLVRQQTFPPLEAVTRAHSFLNRPLYMVTDDVMYRFRSETGLKFDSTRKEKKLFDIFKKNNYTEKTDTDDASENNNLDIKEATVATNLENMNTAIKSGSSTKRDFTSIGSQLRDNVASVQVGAITADHLRRRRSMPAENIANVPKDKNVREVTVGMPQFLSRTVSGLKEAWTRRRGSAPAPIASSEFRGSVAAANRHSMNGGGTRRLPSAANCQQWHTCSYPESGTHRLPRRSSLPVEVLKGIQSDRRN
ncbi:hypothetical protein ACJJTC_000840 [Scirpophaga incertulas]